MDTPASFRSLVRALSSPGAYPLPNGPVTVLETHVSALFFVDGFVYKVKKPLDLGFLDFSTLDKRRHSCEEEVRLNRRLSPDVYVGVVNIARAPDGGLRVEGAGETVEYAVKMARLPEDRMLDVLVDAHAAPEGAIDDIARVVAAFHERCDTGPGVDEHATPEATAQRVRRNADECAAISKDDPGALPPDVLRFMAESALAEAGARAALIEQRVRRGRAREGHGDLHCGNICLTERGVRIIDCIEFARRLRCADVATELAFLGMDLDSRGRADLSRRLLEVYARAAKGERLDELDALQPLFRAHYAAVRAKVTALRARNDGLSDAERETIRSEARRWLAHGVSYLLGPSLVMTCGLPASGKSTAARAVAGALRAKLVHSDVVRKQLAGLEVHDRSGMGDEGGLYSEGHTRRTYHALLGAADEALAAGRSVVVDATFQTRARRASFLELAKRRGVRACVVWMDIDDKTARARLEARAHDAHEPSDADWRVYELLKPMFEPPREEEGAAIMKQPTGAGPWVGEEVAVETIRALAQGRQLRP